MGTSLRRWIVSALALFFRITPVLVIGVLVAPVFAGLWGVLGPAVGYMPQFGGFDFTLAHFVEVLARPGMGTSIWLSLWIGPTTALISLCIAALFVAAWSGTPSFRVVLAILRPVLAVPHAAAAFGFALFIMPSGFLMRLLSPQITGFSRPPDWLLVNDPAGFALLSGLILKEIPFVLLVLLAALPQANENRLRVTISMGYGKIWGWVISVFPAVYAQIRLPIYAVIVFAGSVVDMALVLGPGTPPTLAIRILRWMNDPDLTQKSAAAAAAILQFGVTGLTLLFWWGLEKTVKTIGLYFTLRGQRLRDDRVVKIIALLLTAVTAILVLVSIFILGMLSISGQWRFPDVFPSSYSMKTWMTQMPHLVTFGRNSIVIGLTSSLIAVVLVLGCLENEYRLQKSLSGRALAILYLPLLVPQISFLPGLTVLFLRLGIDGSVMSVVFVHLIFVLPYTYLVLADPWNAFDTRYLDLARALGKSRNAAFLQVRLPILMRPILTAFALGFAISAAQFLPTLLIGGGRVGTITTEAIALGSGGNRRLIGVYGVVQTLLPFVVFFFAALVPAFLWRNRRALRPAAGI